MRKTAAGFSLVELLVVIAIISVLSVIGITSYSSVQSKARDTKRKADIDAIAKVLEIKYDVSTNSYPIVNATSTVLSSGFANNQVLKSPRDDDYVIGTNGKAFVVCSKLDNAPDSLTPQQCVNSISSGINQQNCFCKTSLKSSAQDLIAGFSSGSTSVTAVTINSTGTAVSYAPPVVSDAFDRSNNVSGLGQAPSGQYWTYGGTNSFGIYGNQAGRSNSNITRNIAIIDSGLANAIFNITFSYIQPDSGIVFRYADTNNYYYIWMDGYLRAHLMRMKDGDITELVVSTPYSSNPLNCSDCGTKVKAKVIFNSARIQFYLNDLTNSKIDYTDTDTTLSSNTKVGLFGGPDYRMRWDDMSVQRL